MGSRAAVLEAPRRFALVERSTPEPEAGEVVVRMAATAVCHTDLEIYTGRHPGVRYPVVLGHEATGTVERTGVGVSGFSPGQPVIINPVIACGSCDSCRRDAGHLCRNAGLFGREIDGSLGELVRLPARYLHALPPTLPLDAATLIQTLSTVRHAQTRAGIAAGEAVVILGQGATGLLHTRMAVLAGANPVIAISRSGWKLALARRHGAHRTLDGAAEEVAAEVLRATAGAGADVVVDTVGGGATLTAGIDMLRPGGRLCVFAVSREPVPAFTTFPLYFKEVSLIGSRALRPEDMVKAIELVATGAVDVGGFITATYPLDRIADAFADYERNPSAILRIVISPQEAA